MSDNIFTDPAILAAEKKAKNARSNSNLKIEAALDTVKVNGQLFYFETLPHNLIKNRLQLVAKSFPSLLDYSVVLVCCYAHSGDKVRNQLLPMLTDGPEKLLNYAYDWMCDTMVSLESGTLEYVLKNVIKLDFDQKKSPMTPPRKR